VFGGLLTNPDTFLSGVRASLLIAAGVAALAAAAALLLRTSRTGRTSTHDSIAAKDPS
jgi:MFS transporter, DHA2 family, methylenomycin A resistance protein